MITSYTRLWKFDWDFIFLVVMIVVSVSAVLIKRHLKGRCERMPRSNHFEDAAIDKGTFPDHISSDGTAYYSDGTVLPPPTTDNPTQQKLEPWNREPDSCWSCGGEAEARDDIHVRCIDSKGINCEVMNHWFTRKTWNSRAPVVAPRIYADGYCARCSELAYPLTRALEATGVPTGADNWQQTYGPNKVRALADFESELRRLLLALDEGNPEDVKSRIEWAKFRIEFHAAVRRRLTALAQGREPEPEPAPSPASSSSIGILPR